MKKPTLKKITNDKPELDENHPDACVYYIQYNEDLSQIMLTIQANRPMTPEEYMMALADFVETTKDEPAALFVETVDAMDGYH